MDDFRNYEYVREAYVTVYDENCGGFVGFSIDGAADGRGAFGKLRMRSLLLFCAGFKANVEEFLKLLDLTGF